jgi:hypothetical protein
MAERVRFDNGGIEPYGHRGDPLGSRRRELQQLAESAGFLVVNPQTLEKSGGGDQGQTASNMMMACPNGRDDLAVAPLEEEKGRCRPMQPGQGPPAEVPCYPVPAAVGGLQTESPIEPCAMTEPGVPGGQVELYRCHTVQPTEGPLQELPCYQVPAGIPGLMIESPFRPCTKTDPGLPGGGIELGHRCMVVQPAQGAPQQLPCYSLPAGVVGPVTESSPPCVIPPPGVIGPMYEQPPSPCVNQGGAILDQPQPCSPGIPSMGGSELSLCSWFGLAFLELPSPRNLMCQIILLPWVEISRHRLVGEHFTRLWKKAAKYWNERREWRRKFWQEGKDALKAEGPHFSDEHTEEEYDEQKRLWDIEDQNREEDEISRFKGNLYGWDKWRDAADSWAGTTEEFVLQMEQDTKELDDLWSQGPEHNFWQRFK